MPLFELIQITVGARRCFSRTLSAAKWGELFLVARQHAIAGWLYTGVSALPPGQRPPREIMLRWYALAEQLRRINRAANAECVETQERLAADGFRPCILKGQGLATLYPDPALRAPGDIDVWLEGSRRSILHYVRRRFPDAHVCYHHAECDDGGRFCKELHFMPSWMSSPIMNSRLQRFFAETSAAEFTHTAELPEGQGRICVPTDRFNAVYVLLHIFRHFLDEGVGLRQLADYYHCLLRLSADDRAAAVAQLSRLGLHGFSSALMHVMQEVFALDCAFLLCPPDRRKGARLLAEIMQAGNFGQNDERLRRLSRQDPLSRFLRHLARNVRFVRDYPGETLWGPLAKVYHYYWRKFYGGHH